VFELDALPRARREAKAAAQRLHGRDRKHHRRSPRPPRGSAAQGTHATERLLDDLERRRLLPALVFAFSRKDCERLARRNASRNLLDDGERARMIELQRELTRTFRLAPEVADSELMAMARRGSGYHHAGMLPIDKELVERMFTSGLLKLLFTTETFALGINMPARSVVFHTLEKFDGTSLEYLRRREFLQMAGRAGRQGIDKEGLVFAIVDDEDLRKAPLERILTGEPEPVRSRFRLSYSSLLHLVSELSRERVHEAWDKSFNHFQFRGGGDKERERNRRRQRRMVDAHLAVLDELGYLENGDQLTPRGRVARLINGFELQTTALLFEGVLEHLPPRSLAVVFAALCYEERRRNFRGWASIGTFAALKKRVTHVMERLAECESRHGVATPFVPPDWSLALAVAAWCDGSALDELAEFTDVGPGDLVRTLRMAVQLMRQVRRAIDRSWDLRERLDRAVALVNRGQVDARAQLELK
jgi:superfamily II RNA helicase